MFCFCLYRFFFVSSFLFFSHFIHSATINLQLSFHFHWKLFRDWVWYDCYDCTRVVYTFLHFTFYARLLLYGNINCILFVFFLFNCSQCRVSSSGVKMLFNDIKRNWLESNCESSCAAYVRMCVVLRVLLVPFNWNISAHSKKPESRASKQ